MKPRRRHLVIVGSALAHGALLALLFTAKPPPGVAEVGVMSVSLFDGKALAGDKISPAPARVPAPAPPPPVQAKVELEPVPPTDVEPQFIDVSLVEPDPADREAVDDPVAISVAAAASAAAGSACDMTQWLRQALQADPQVQDALAHIPRPARSVANAIMLWDRAWVGTGSAAASGVATIRLALVAGIRAAPAACRDQALRGPELFTLVDAVGTTVVAVGSGEWRWADVLQSEAVRLASSAPMPAHSAGAPPLSRSHLCLTCGIFAFIK